MKRVVYITGMVLGERRERGNLLTEEEEKSKWGEREREPEAVTDCLRERGKIVQSEYWTNVKGWRWWGFIYLFIFHSYETTSFWNNKLNKYLI